MQQGTIGVTTENIFPVIKKFLYSDHEIFLREMVSNAVDATQKLKTLAAKGEFKGSTDNLTVHIKYFLSWNDNFFNEISCLRVFILHSKHRL